MQNYLLRKIGLGQILFKAEWRALYVPVKHLHKMNGSVFGELCCRQPWHSCDAVLMPACQTFQHLVVFCGQEPFFEHLVINHCFVNPFLLSYSLLQ